MREVTNMKMDEFKKSIFRLSIDHLRIIVECAESDMEEIREAIEQGRYKEYKEEKLAKMSGK
jgi:queuine/archaeosine tRNA-ribosyltransferase